MSLFPTPVADPPASVPSDPTVFPLTVSAAGSPSMCNASVYRGVNVCLLEGHSRVHAGPCRLVVDPLSPLRFCAVGDVLPVSKRERVSRDDRWVVLVLADGADPKAVDAIVRECFGAQVRLEYAPGVE